MNHQLHTLSLLSCLGVLLVSAAIDAKENADSSIVERAGRLQVKGNKIVDQHGRFVELHGMALYWSQWKGQFYNESSVQWLVDDWKCTVVRASMGVESGGYLTNPAAEKAKVTAVIDACINAGVYVIVDWHDHHGQWHTAQAVEFFEEIASTYGDYPNLIYEIYNEPLQISWKDSIKPYADTLVKHIRAIDPDNLILVGSSTWSQDVDIATANPVVDTNAAYTLHFYAATHKQSLRNKAATALNRGYAIFVSEFGTVTSSGNGTIDSAETDIWLKFLKDNKISWANWSVADLSETSAILLPGTGASQYGGWTDNQISPSGIYVRRKLREAYDSTVTVTEVKLNFELPREFQLYQNYPNPFNPVTIIQYKLSPNPSPNGRGEGVRVTLKVYDVLGKEVATLVNEQKSPGAYEVQWIASSLPSGVYFYQLRAGNSVATKKLILTK